MGLMGARVKPVEAGARTLKEAFSVAIRDWVANVGDTHHIIGSAVGPTLYLALVRDLQRVIGDEARPQILSSAGRLPGVIACVSGGSNAIRSFVPFVEDAGLEGATTQCMATWASPRGRSMPGRFPGESSLGPGWVQ